MLHKEDKKNLDRQALLGFPPSLLAPVPEKSKRARFREKVVCGKLWKHLLPSPIPSLVPFVVNGFYEPRRGPAVEAHACDPSTQEMGAGGSSVLDHPSLSKV